MDGIEPSAESRHMEICKLVDRNQARCLWNVPLDHQAESDLERARALAYIQQHVDRDSFVRARELQERL